MRKNAEGLEEQFWTHLIDRNNRNRCGAKTGGGVSDERRFMEHPLSRCPDCEKLIAPEGKPRGGATKKRR